MRLESEKDWKDARVPDYAILSHTWDAGEMKFEDVQKSRAGDKAGIRKVEFCLSQAAADGIQYCWVDSCCIDRAENAELQHTINSMFQ